MTNVVQLFRELRRIASTMSCYKIVVGDGQRDKVFGWKFGIEGKSSKNYLQLLINKHYNGSSLFVCEVRLHTSNPFPDPTIAGALSIG